MAEHQWSPRDHTEEAVPRRKAESVEKLGARETGDSLRAAGLRGGADALSRIVLSRPGNVHRKADLLTSLQRSCGNGYVQRLLQSRALQAKLTVSPPDDEFEREADAVGETVSRLPVGEIRRQEMPEEEEQVQADRLQRQAEEEEEQIQAERLQRQSSPEEEELVQAKSAAGSVPEVTDGVERRIDAQRGGGAPLPDSLRAPLESHFGHDLAGVRLHTDAEAGDLAERLEARAFTIGSDIFFRGGDYQPDSTEGRKLLGHEITHVVQQGAAPQRAPRDE